MMLKCDDIMPPMSPTAASIYARLCYMSLQCFVVQ